MKTATTRSAKKPKHDHDLDYALLLQGFGSQFQHATRDPGTRLFCTDAVGLNDLYLDTLPDERQVHNCHACRRFLDTYGGLVTIDGKGRLQPVFWRPNASSIPEFYLPVVDALHDRVVGANVIGPFYTDERFWGNSKPTGWSHFEVLAPERLLYKNMGKSMAHTPFQAMAAAVQDYQTVERALAEYPAPVIEQALRIFKGDHVARAGKYINPTEWLMDMHNRPKGKAGANVLWAHVVAAPAGYLHPKASVVGPLLENIKQGVPFNTIKAEFDKMMAPDRYQRPQAPPSAGNIEQAEKLVDQLGIRRSLERRFARLDELQLLWRPKNDAAKPDTGGVFSHLTPKTKKPEPTLIVDLPPRDISWEKFARDVLPTADDISVWLDDRTRNFGAFLTAVHDDAPLILKWDNPVSWYLYQGGSTAARWGLRGRSWATVTGVSLLPCQWGGPVAYTHDGALLALEGAVDQQPDSLGLFPEVLKTELHSIRATIEAHSKSQKLAGSEEASACGLIIDTVGNGAKVRVWSQNQYADYQIVRWE